MAGRGDLSDLSAQLSGLERGRDRRPSGHRRASALHRLARCRRDLDFAVLHLANEGFRLRRVGLLRRRSDVRHAGRFRRGDRNRAYPRPQGDDRPRPVAHLRRTSLVQDQPREPGKPARRLVCLGRCQARRHAAQQLAVDFRGQRMAVGQHPPAILPPQFPHLAARPQLPQRRGAGRALGRGPVLAGSRRRRLPARYHQLLHPRRRTQEQPAAEAPRPRPP